MKITLHDARTLRLTFPYSAETQGFVTSLVGAMYFGERITKCRVPLCHLRAILDRFPQATIVNQAEVIEARYALWRRWLVAHNEIGIYFALSPDDAATVVAYRDAPEGGHPEPVSDVLQAHVAKRSPQLAPWLHCQRFPSAPAMPRDVRPTVWDVAEPTHADRLIHAGIQNAVRREEERAEVVERAKGKRRQAVQMELLTEE